jgi:ferredoxin
LGDAQLIKMAGVPPVPIGGKENKVGFVFPSYYGNLPRLVRAFVKGLEIKPDTYIFTVVTGGGAMTGSIRELRVALAEKSLQLSYAQRLYMKGNYIAKYNPADPAKMDKTLVKADARILAFAKDIAAGSRKSVTTLPITANNLYKDIELLDAAFTVNDACAGCGLCEKLCPVSNILINASKPEWLHHCEHCMACISWCPTKAIDYGDQTRFRRRYHNPRIKADELINK